MTRRIAASSLTLGAFLFISAFGLGWYFAARTQGELMTGLPPSWSDLIWNNLRVTLILCGGLDIMRHTRHKSVQIMRRYDRTSGLWIRNATTGVSL